MNDPHDDGVIRLNPDDPTFDLWQTRRDFSRDPKRDPGPINVQKWPGGWAYQRIGRAPRGGTCEVGVGTD